MIKDKAEQFRELAKEVNDKYKKSGLARDVVFLVSDCPDRVKPQLISTGHEEWDKPLCGGIPKGAVTVLHGAPWTGKTSFALGVAKQLIEQGKYVLYVNLEAIPLDAYSHIIGVEGSETRKFLAQLNPTTTAEHLIADIEYFLYDREKRAPRGLFDLIIIDSQNNLHTDAKEKAWLESPDKVPQMASKAKLLDDFLSRLYGKGMMGENDTAVVIIAHDRANIGGPSNQQGPKTVMSGGESLKFNSKVTLRLSRRANKSKTGQEVTMTIEKNSCTGQLGDGVISILYKKGKDDTQTLIDRAKEFKYLIPGDSKTQNILILPGLGDLVINAVKKTADAPGRALATVIAETIRDNPEVAESLRITLAGKKPIEGKRNGFEYFLTSNPDTVIEEDE